MDGTLVATAEEAPREADIAFDRLYRSSRDDVYAYVASLVRDPAAAEDVTAPRVVAAAGAPSAENPHIGWLDERAPAWTR